MLTLFLLVVLIMILFSLTFPRQRDYLIHRIETIQPPDSVNTLAMVFLLAIGPILFSRKFQMVGVFILLAMIFSNVL